MIRKLVKDWNNLPAGAGVTLDPAEQVVLVDADRLVHLEREGHLQAIASVSILPNTREEAKTMLPREIPDEVRTITGEKPDGSVGARAEIADDIARGGPIRRRPPEEPPPLPESDSPKEK